MRWVNLAFRVSVVSKQSRECSWSAIDRLSWPKKGKDLCVCVCVFLSLSLWRSFLPNLPSGLLSKRDMLSSRLHFTSWSWFIKSAFPKESCSCCRMKPLIKLPVFGIAYELMTMPGLSCGCWPFRQPPFKIAHHPAVWAFYVPKWLTARAFLFSTPSPLCAVRGFYNENRATTNAGLHSTDEWAWWWPTTTSRSCQAMQQQYHFIWHSQRAVEREQTLTQHSMS